MAELLECPVCLETYRDPQLLAGCGHTFCRRCVDALRPQRCPTCRGAFQPRDVRPNFALRLVLQDVAESNEPAPPHRDASAADLEATGGSCSRGSSQASSSSSIARVSRGEEGVESRIEAMASLGVPWGLARLIQEEDSQIALRLFLLDNSGSTATTDGRVLCDAPGGHQSMMCCSRWEEIQNMAMHQARWNARIGTPCEFLLLNPPSRRAAGAFRPGVDFVRVDPALGDADAQLAQLDRMLRMTQPRGPTPLAERLDEVHARIEREQAELCQAGHHVVVCIATDGLPTGEYSGKSTDYHCQRVVRALRKLTGDLPVHIVVRLTTEEDSVVEFYNKIDEEFELPLEVLDDIESEAKEIASAGNRWLAYSPLLHAIREGGTFVKLFDLLDERRLTPVEAMILARMLLQDPHEVMPTDAEEFCQYVEDRLQRGGDLVYHPLTGRLAPCVDPRLLRQAVLPPRFCGGLCSRRRRPPTAPAPARGGVATALGAKKGGRGYNALQEPEDPAGALPSVMVGRPVA